MDNLLVLVRHGESEWNKLNLFTGWRDPDLTETGIEEAKHAGKLIRETGIRFDIAYTSALVRAQNTLKLILEELEQTDLETIRDQALNERDYGDLAGLNKDDARKKWGEEQVHIWRRSYDIPPPGGESLKDTAARTLPYYEEKIWPALQAGKNVLVAAHGNSLRSIVMKLDQLSQEEVLGLNIATGAPIVYRLNEDGTVAEKRELIS
jgi:2,3-bisphosphoglycerate-dependent phosphoglycerate mutase